MKKDNIFALKKEPVAPFEFNEEVTSVFDDMIKRSVPLYMESLKRQCQMISLFYKSATTIYDLGCSHGNLGMMVYEAFKERDYTMVAVDSSPSMIERYRKRLERVSPADNLKDSPEKKDNFEQPFGNCQKIDNIHLVCGLAEEQPITSASVVVVNLTMQFIKPEKRDQFIKRIYDGMASNGILLLTEKVIHENSTISEIQQGLYRTFKMENGYSELEISRKRDALENILIPETIESHTERLKRAGFETMDIWLKWFNFASMVAIK